MRTLNSQDLALLSDHVYGNKGILVFDDNQNRKTLNGITYEVIEQKENKENGYFGVVLKTVRMLKPICRWCATIVTANIRMRNC